MNCCYHEKFLIGKEKQKSDLTANDYPKNGFNLLFKILGILLNSSVSLAQLPKKIYMKAPYFIGLSKLLSCHLRKFNIFLYHVYGWSLKFLIFNFKHQNFPLNSIGEFYNIPCKICKSC